MPMPLLPHNAHEVIVIDAGIPDWQTLVANLNADTSIILLPPGGNGLAALAHALDDYGSIDALHLFSHGSDGQLHLGDLRLNSANLAEQSVALAQIASHFTANSDLLLYGCNLAQDARGEAFIHALSQTLNNVVVAASNDKTGAAALGGDWDLEYWTGQIHTLPPFAAEDIVHYNAATFTDDGLPPSLPTPDKPVLAVASDTGYLHTDNITSATVLSLSGTGALADTTIRLFDGTTELASATADGSGNWSVDTPTLAAGVHAFIVYVYSADTYGPASDTLSVTIDTSAPRAQGVPRLAARSDSGVANDDLTNDTTPSITGVAEANATVRLYDTDGVTQLASASADGSGNWSVVSAPLSTGTHSLTVTLTDAAGNLSGGSGVLTLGIDPIAPSAPPAPRLAGASDSGITGDNATDISTPLITGTGEPNATVKLYDGDAGTLLGSALVDDAGNWHITSTELAIGAHSLRARQTDAAGNGSPAGEPLALTIAAPPVPLIVDGVPVTTEPVTLPGGAIGTATVVPIVSSGPPAPDGAHIALAYAGATPLLQALLTPGYGLSSSGAPSAPAGASLAQLTEAILAATPALSAADQMHLTSNGQSFLHALAAGVPLLVQTVVPISSVSAPDGSLTLTGTSSASQHTALVIDASQLAPGSKIVLQAVDFAAIVGAADVSGATPGQVLSGDFSNQHFTVAASAGSAVFAGAGDDTLSLAPAAALVRPAVLVPAAGPVPDLSAALLLHGGSGADTLTLNGLRSDYTLQTHDGYAVLSTLAQPTVVTVLINVETLTFSDLTVTLDSRGALCVLAGVYQDMLGRQPDWLGFDFWGQAEHNGASLGQIALNILTSPESQARHQVLNGDNGHDVELLYQTVFARHSDAGGFAFWVGQMDRGATLAQVADAFLHSTEIVGHSIAPTGWNFVIG